MIIHDENLLLNSQEIYRKEDFTLLNTALNLTTSASLFNKKLFEFTIASKLKNYLKHLSLSIYRRQVVDGKLPRNADKGICDAYCQLLNQLDMIQLYNFEERLLILKLQYIENSKEINRIEKDSNFVLESLEKKGLFGTNLSKYLYFVIKYIKIIGELSLSKKVDSNLAESFYSDLGELAFDLFNKSNYITVLHEKKISTILDIGCGNGNFIDLYLGKYSDALIVGVDLQTPVCEKLQKKYEKNKNVSIFNDNILNLSFEQQFDLINMSYMLFYLNEDEQYKLFKKLNQILASDGEVTMCQYFPNIESLQVLVAMEDKKWGKIDRYKFGVSQNILYAEILLNESLSAFDKAVRFPSFSKLLNKTGFKIGKIYKADDNFYSFYFVLKKVN